MPYVSFDEEHNNFAILTAAEEGYKETVGLLLAKGANVDAKDRDHNGSTPLILASAKGAKEIVTILLERRADVNAKDNLAEQR